MAPGWQTAQAQAKAEVGLFEVDATIVDWSMRRSWGPYTIFSKSSSGVTPHAKPIAQDVAHQLASFLVRFVGGVRIALLSPTAHEAVRTRQWRRAPPSPHPWDPP